MGYFHGPKPELKQLADYESIAKYISERIIEVTEKESSPQSEIAVLYTMKSSNNGTVGLDNLDSKRWSDDQINNLTYVAMTRARYQLIIPFTKETPLIKKLKEAII